MTMKKNLALGATATVVAAITLAGAGIRLAQGNPFFKNNPNEVVDEVWQAVNRNYLDATFNQEDWMAVRTEYVRDRVYNQPEDAYAAIKEMLEKLGDPYTRFLEPDEFRNMQIDTSGELTGVGIQLGQDRETNELVVVAPIEDSPAFSAGVLAKDKIVAIDGKSTEGMDINDAVKLIRGPVGTTVTLTVTRDEKKIEFPIKRDRIELHPVRHEERKEENAHFG
ncbi:MAG: PDZ domain-containing protein, partial [Cyanobacteria bacterium P01_D01_bin.73]